MAVARMFIALALLGTPVPVLAQHEGHGGAEAQAVPRGANPYERGLYLLHNFEYATAAAAFRDAQIADPSNVMAYWGEAMTYNHPLWAEQDAGAARAVLARLGPDPASRRSKARSTKEAAWLGAVEALYGSGSKIERDAAYHERMRALFEADRADIDARTFYALATLGLASQGRDTALYMKSAALLEEAMPSHPDHPGLLHYMIHSYDDPAHAPLGERAAARYAQVAPDAGHAQHMISHIYLALGRWNEVERANVTASKLVNEQRAANGRPPTGCGHYMNGWLMHSTSKARTAANWSNPAVRKHWRWQPRVKTNRLSAKFEIRSTIGRISQFGTASTREIGRSLIQFRPGIERFWAASHWLMGACWLPAMMPLQPAPRLTK